MQPEKRRATNVPVGIGVVLQMAGFVLLHYLPSLGDDTAVGAVLIVASIPIIVWGCMSYADGKGYSRSVGQLGVLGVVGLIVLVLLPDRAGELRVPLGKIIAVVGLTTGFGLVLLGLWLNALGGDVRIEQMLGWWPGISMLAGFCLAVGSLPPLLGNGSP